MASPHPVGARIVKLDERLARAEIAAHEWHEGLDFVIPPAAALVSSNRAARTNIALPHAFVRPWPPAHLRAERVASGDIAVTWVRCARLAGDAWGPGEPPVGAPAEGYLVQILDGGEVVRAVEVAIPSFAYLEADQIEDLGAPPALLRIRVAQLGESGAPGLNSELTITL
jgi:hypothetical protein